MAVYRVYISSEYLKCPFKKVEYSKVGMNPGPPALTNAQELAR